MLERAMHIETVENFTLQVTQNLVLVGHVASCCVAVHMCTTGSASSERKAGEVAV
jgi:hypothetical protein